jgi:hypothetical protein
MQSARVHCRDDLVNGHIGGVAVANCSPTERTDARIHGRRISCIKIVEVHFREGHVGLRCLEGNERASINDPLGASDQRASGTREQFDVGSSCVP